MGTAETLERIGRFRLKLTPLAEALKREIKRDDGIEGMWPRGSLVSMFGETGSGKTFLALNLGLSIASDTPWCGHKVHCGAVVYVAGEDAWGVVLRLQAHVQVHPEVTQAAFAVVEQAVDLPNENAVTEFVEIVTQEFGQATELVIIDTADSCFGSVDDSSPVGMRLFVDACKRIRDELGCTVLILMHPGHDNTDRERGGSNFKAAMDVRYRVRAQGDTEQVLEHIKMKNGPLNPPMVFERRVVELSDDVTSCVLDHKIDAVVAAPTTRGPSKQSRAVVDALDAALKAHGKNAKDVFDTTEGIDHLAAYTQVVSVNDWRTEAYRRVLNEHSHDARRQAFRRAKEDLAANKWALELDGYAYRVKKNESTRKCVG